MCTLIININEGIGFNRDESYKRKSSQFPQEFIRGEIRAIFPIDGDFGGTWIAANSRGRIYALMNYYEKRSPAINTTSRGLLVREMALGNLTEPSEYANYQPFKLYVFARGGSPQKFIWDGESIIKEVLQGEWLIAGSSALMGEAADKTRKGLFEKQFLDNKDWLNKSFREKAEMFLKSHDPEKGALSPCMHRQDAHTVSMTVISFIGKGVDLHYKAGNPCENGSEYDCNLTIV